VFSVIQNYELAAKFLLRPSASKVLKARNPFFAIGNLTRDMCQNVSLKMSIRIIISNKYVKQHGSRPLEQDPGSIQQIETFALCVLCKPKAL